jgi:hypothetical protein
MKHNRKHRLKKGAAGKPETAVRPTRQTAARLRPDIIRRLYTTGRIADHHALAARQIRTVFEAVGRSMLPHLMLGQWTGAAPRHRPGRDFLDRMSDYERHLWQRYYLPWTHEMAVEIAAGLPGVRWLKLVIDVVVENCSLRETEFAYGLGRGRAIEYLVSGLEIYARHARLVR